MIYKVRVFAIFIFALTSCDKDSPVPVERTIKWSHTNGPNGGDKTTRGIFRSNNNGESWTSASTGLGNTYINCLAISDHYIFAGTYGGVFMSDNNGETWKVVNAGLTNRSIRSLATGDHMIVAGTEGGGAFISPL